MIALTLFAGAGGADVGLRDAGMEHARCVRTSPSDAAINRATVARLLAEHPRRTDAQIARLASIDGIHICGETVRRHRLAIGIGGTRGRNRRPR